MGVLLGFPWLDQQSTHPARCTVEALSLGCLPGTAADLKWGWQHWEISWRSSVLDLSLLRDMHAYLSLQRDASLPKAASGAEHFG